MLMNKTLNTASVEALLNWYDRSRRDLPWRKTRDPYCIWISEIMLQQTRVEAVKPYYARFLQACPDVASLASISEDELLKLWEGLGYYSRARNLQRAARSVMEQHGGVLPRNYEALRGLSGIGEYTAGAIASIAYDERVPAVDGNVLRVLTRLIGSYEDITLPQTKKGLRDALSSIIPDRAGDFNQALIELGATVCVPNGAPKCEECPLRNVCVASREGLCAQIPVKAPKKPRRIEERTVFLIRDGSRTALCKRAGKGLLAGLFELPNTEGHLDRDVATEYLRALGVEPLRIERIEDAKHIFTHIEWHMIAYSVRISAEFDGWHGEGGMMLVPNAELFSKFAIPSAFSAYTKYLLGKDARAR
ncbi:MAG: A/G-specific adenine glycosylase [Clostridia bacterium]|nr:A/G-specific adenine glycosylase [Clostridia bacterium]